MMNQVIYIYEKTTFKCPKNQNKYLYIFYSIGSINTVFKPYHYLFTYRMFVSVIFYFL